MNTRYNLTACLAMAAALGCFSVQADASQDKAITEQVKSTFSAHPDVGTSISVSTKDGVVYLKGTATTSLARSHAEELAKAVPGVQKVVDDIGLEK